MVLLPSGYSKNGIYTTVSFKYRNTTTQTADFAETVLSFARQCLETTPKKALVGCVFITGGFNLSYCIWNDATLIQQSNTNLMGTKLLPKSTLDSILSIGIETVIKTTETIDKTTKDVSDFWNGLANYYKSIGYGALGIGALWLLLKTKPWKDK